MPKYLIEVPHENSKGACERAIQAFMSTGSHFVTNADWGCVDDVHKSWLTVETGSKEEALSLLPPAFRKDAKVITVENFSSDTMQAVKETHR